MFIMFSQRTMSSILRQVSSLSESFWMTPYNNLCLRSMSASTNYDFKTMKVTDPAKFVKQVEFCRPDKRNSMNTDFWREMPECFKRLSTDKSCRAIVLSGEGKAFTSGLDFQDNEAFAIMMQDCDIGRKAMDIKRIVLFMQESFNAIEKCSKPVIAAVHGACIGGGIDMIAACDIRYATQDAWFQIKEIDLGLAADLGTLSRFSNIVGNDSVTRELVYTARKFYCDEAKSLGFVGRTFQDKSEMISSAVELAQAISKKSPVAVQGSKVNLIYARDHNVQQSMEYITTWNAAMLQSEDVMKAVSALIQKEEPEFNDL